MDNIREVIESLRRNLRAVRFAELANIRDRFIGEPRRRGTSHHVYTTPWRCAPRVNIQSRRAMAKGYQVRQVITPLEKLENTIC